MRVKRDDLGQLKELASGGYGKVYDCPQYHLSSDPSPIVFKEFTVEVAQQARAAENAVIFRELLDPADRADLDRCTVWPLALVVDQAGSVVGLLMHRIGQEFFFDSTLTGKKELRDLQWLIATPTQLAANGLPDFDETDRLALLAQLVYDVARLHKQNWVYGDLSQGNAAFAANPPRMILLDCDGAADLRDPRRKQAHTPNWKPPECEQLDVQDKATDVYKLGLAILRSLSTGKGAGSTRDPGRVKGKLDAAGEALVARAVAKDPASRPTAKELYAYLRRVVVARTTPPAVIGARLTTPMRVRGMDARVEWEIANVAEVTIRVGATAPMVVAAAAGGGPQFHVFPARESGPVTIEAENRYGAVRVDLGELTLYEIPPFDPKSFIGVLPRLEVPTLEAFTLDALNTALESVPRVAVPALPPPPALGTARVTDVLRGMVPAMGGGAESVRLPLLGALVAEASREITKQLTSQARELAETQRASHLKALADAEEDN